MSKKLKKVINALNINLEEAVVEVEDNAKTICQLEEKVKILSDKLEKSEEKNAKLDAKVNIKDKEIESIQLKKHLTL